MYKMKRNDSGITLLVLVITIVGLTIIASITVYEGKELLNKAKLNTLEANMLTIQAKTKAYAEEIEAKIWTKESNKDSERDKAFINDKKFLTVTSIEQGKYLYRIANDIKKDEYVTYKVTGEALEKIGLKDIKNDVYYVIFNKDDYKKIDVIYVKDNDVLILSEIQTELKGSSNN